jgi:hypothetical protein
VRVVCCAALKELLTAPTEGLDVVWERVMAKGNNMCNLTRNVLMFNIFREEQCTFWPMGECPGGGEWMDGWQGRSKFCKEMCWAMDRLRKENKSREEFEKLPHAEREAKLLKTARQERSMAKAGSQTAASTAGSSSQVWRERERERAWR